MEESIGGGGSSQLSEPGSAPLQQLPEAPPYKTLTNSRTKTDGTERQAGRQIAHTQTYTHTHRLAPSFGMVHPSPGDRVSGGRRGA